MFWARLRREGEEDAYTMIYDAGGSAEFTCSMDLGTKTHSTSEYTSIRRVPSANNHDVVRYIANSYGALQASAILRADLKRLDSVQIVGRPDYVNNISTLAYTPVWASEMDDTRDKVGYVEAIEDNYAIRVRVVVADEVREYLYPYFALKKITLEGQLDDNIFALDSIATIHGKDVATVIAVAKNNDDAREIKRNYPHVVIRRGKTVVFAVTKDELDSLMTALTYNGKPKKIGTLEVKYKRKNIIVEGTTKNLTAAKTFLRNLSWYDEESYVDDETGEKDTLLWHIEGTWNGPLSSLESMVRRLL